MRFKTKFGLIWESKKTVEERRRGEERRIGRGEEEQVKPSSKRYGTNLDYGFYEIWYGSLVCMMINLVKPRVLLEFHLNPKIMESKVG